MILIQRLLPDAERLMDIGVRIGLGVVLGFLFQRLCFLLVGRVEKWVALVAGRRVTAGHGLQSTAEHARQRARTVGSIFRSVVTGIVALSVMV